MNLYRPTWNEINFDRLFNALCDDLLDAPEVDTGHWQAKTDVPQTATKELLNVTLEIPIHNTSGAWASWVKPNLPWAETHFQERVSGKPLNPPPSHVDWPYNQQGNKGHMDGEAFSHSYPERLWPKHAPIESGPLIAGYGNPPDPFCASPQSGIRYPYGDLNNAVDLLVQEPHSRQCFIPIWSPEDLHAAAVEHQRVPCTLGYHMLLRDNKLMCFYPMRSLDALRYLRDDMFMAGRLVQWVLSQVRANSGENSVWHDANPGLLTMFAVSLHIFQGDVPGLEHKLKKKARNL